jgi:hypothetical protein
LFIRAALEDVKMDLAERSHRWQQIEKICGFNITTNPGIQYLESLLRSTGHPSSELFLSLSPHHHHSFSPQGSLTSNLIASTVEEADEDSASGGPLAAQGKILCFDFLLWSMGTESIWVHK